MTLSMRGSLVRFWHSFGVALFVVVGLLSLGVLAFTRQRLEEAAAQAVALTDQVNGARTAILRAENVVASTGPDESVPPVAIAELDNAAAHLSDLVEGRSGLLGIEVAGLEGDPVGAALADSVSTLVARLRHLLATSAGEASDLELRLGFGDLRARSADLERHMQASVMARLDAEHATQIAVLLGWALFLGVTGIAVELLRRARLHAIRDGQTAEEGRLAAMAQRNESERRLQSLRTQADAGLILVDEGGKIREMSRWWERSLGLPETDWLERPWWTLFHEEESARLMDLWQDRARHRSTFALEVRGRPGADGRDVWLSGRWRPADSGGGASDGSWVGTFLDVTQLRVIEAQLNQAQKLEAVGRMTSGIAHDFNNLLAVIRTNVELLREGAESDEEREELLHDIEQSAASGRELIQGLMRFSRREKLQIQHVELSEVVRATSRMASKLLTDGIDMTTELPESGPVVHADPRALQQILLNLVTNARDAMPEGGRLVISVDDVEADERFVEERPWIEPGRFGRITVTDSGIGMSRETLDRIFEPFFSTKAEGVGTGLGLASVHGLVRQQGGHVHAYSEVGVGTSFRVYLPAAELDASGVAASEAGSRPAVGAVTREARRSPRETPGAPEGRVGPVTARERLRVLLVEDDEALRRTSQRVLVRMGHEVRTVADAEEALELMDGQEPPFDLVISDISMDHVDGIELVRRSRATGLRIPFVLTSGRHASQLVGVSALPDDVAFLPKPWSVQTLQDAIREARRRA